MNSCYIQGNPSSCALITRDIAGSIYGNPGEVHNIAAQTRNFLGGLETEGFDFGANYRMDTADWGSFLFRWDRSYVAYFGDVGQPEIGQINRDGDISAGNLIGRLPSGSSQGAPRHRLRSNLATTWDINEFSFTATVEYRSKVRESCNNVVNTANALAARLGTEFLELRNLCSDPGFAQTQYSFRPGTNEIVTSYALSPQNKLGGVTYTHLQGSWNAPWDGKISAAVRNLFDKDPPFSSDAFANSFDAQYLIPGRYFYASYEQRF